MRNESLRAADHGLDSRVWALYRDGSHIYARCRACEHETDRPKREIRRCKEHERGQGHKKRLLDRELADPIRPLINSLDNVEANSYPQDPEAPYIIPEEQRHLTDQGTVALLASLNARFSPRSSPPSAEYSSTSFDPLPTHWIEQNTFGIYEDTPEPHGFTDSEAEAIYDLTHTLLGMDEPPTDEDSDSQSVDSDDQDDPNYFDQLQQDEEEANFGLSADEVFVGEQDEELVNNDDFGGNSTSRKCQRMAASDPQSERWYPWPDRITCTLDILMHLPRSVFSQHQLDLFLWLLKVNRVDDVPSVYQMKSINQKLQEWVGIETIQNTSPFGNVYHVNNFSQIVAQAGLQIEVANPRVRPFLHFFPEDAGTHVSEARHARRWLEEVPDDYAPQMIRFQHDDYYIHEPTRIWNHDSGEEYCVPILWFSRSNRMWSRCKILRICDTAEGSGWVVLNDEIEVEETQLLMSFPRLCESYTRYGVPDPRRIFGIWYATHQCMNHWNYPTTGNPWRSVANGRRVVSLPVWMYCDDTSGNVLKKWNKHNSFLFTLAGLS
ncbi:hypothetical protein AAF712_006245 [Marasmius tenuissimus]|uniref:Uncharacterized protein n=1 Tax=Marasmius tenuissimus TaxID=585030 RepID=A0ABR2ZZ47_9AGAR